MIAEQLLRKITILSGLDSAELVQLGSVLKERRAPKGSFIVCADDPGPSLMFISEGSVKINLVSQDGKEIVLAYLEEGDFFGEIALLTGEDRSANVIAIEDCRLFVLSAEDFKTHIMKSFGLSFAIMRELAERLRGASSKIGDLALFDVYRRVARSLKSLGTPATEGDSTVYVIDKRPTHQELASIVGTSREMVTRALKGLEEDGCIVMDGKQIIVRKLPL